jgi:hypothetical protein
VVKEGKMGEAKCPICGCEEFYVKDPGDEYETYAFKCKDGEVCFNPDVDCDAAPEVEDETETFCNRCSWHDKLGVVKK